jgi:hypothetical protein
LTPDKFHGEWKLCDRSRQIESDHEATSQA